MIKVMVWLSSVDLTPIPSIGEHPILKSVNYLKR
jgi:hypothetical protein